MQTQRIPGYCALCRSRCGAQYLVEDGRLTGVEPWVGHPTGGALCAKGRAAPELLYHPRRLRQPLRRTRPKTDTDPGWVEVSWDEALDDIAARLLRIKAESGAHAVAFSSASPGASAIADSLEWIERLIFCFGSPNFLTGVEICNWQRDHGHAFSIGSGIGMPDYARSDLVILWGFNPGNVWLGQAQALAQARARGARLLVVDPSGTRHARDADHWLRVRPGTDAALALGLAHLLIGQGAYDEAFVRCWSNGPFLVRDDTGQPLTERAFDPFAARDRPMAWDLALGEAVPVDCDQPLTPAQSRGLALRGSYAVAMGSGTITCRPGFEHYVQVCAHWTTERTAQFTGVPAAQIEEVARVIAQSRCVSYFSWTGISQHVNGSQADRAIALLYALTGDLDAPGGNLQHARQPAARVNARDMLEPGQAARTLGLDRHPLGPPAHGWALGRDFHAAVLSGEPYRVRALVGFGANLLMSQADTPRARAALERLEFQVHCDLFDTPTARTADYLLPVNTPWEREALRIGFEISAQGEELVQLRKPVVAQQPGDGARADLAIVFDLAVRLGLGAQFFGGSIDAGWDHQLAPLGLTVAQLRGRPEGVRRPLEQVTRKYAQRQSDGTLRGFDTPSRRVEFYSAQMQARGLSPVPDVLEPLAGVAMDDAERAAYPLTLSTAKTGRYCQSQHRALASLRRREPDPGIRLHPSLAAARGIGEGDWCSVSTRNGHARFRARLDMALDPQVLVASFGWWQGCDDLGLAAADPLADGNSHYNGLISTEHTDALAGSIALRAFPCDIAPIAAMGHSWEGWKPFWATVQGLVGDVLELQLHPEHGGVLPGFRPGQHVALALEAVQDGDGRQRSYSLTGAASEAGCGTYRIGVKRGAAAGGVSRQLHALASSGSPMRVWLRPPRGSFLLPARARARPVVLVAAGIGITPFLSLLETLAAAPEQPSMEPVLLLHGSRDGASHPFAARLSALARRLPQLRIVNAYSQPAATDQQGRDYQHRGRVDIDMVEVQWITRGARFYLCGPDAMLTSLRSGLAARGVPPWAIFVERFETPVLPVTAAAGPFQVRLARSGRVLAWTPKEGSLLALAEAHGLSWPSGCRIGQCESCRVPLRSGQVRHLVEVDPPEDGTCLGCVAVPCSDLVIDR